MEVNLGDERIVELRAAYSLEQVQEKALAKRRAYRVEVTPEVPAVTVYGNECPVAGERARAFQLEAVEQVVRVLNNDALFDIGANASGAVLPGANVVVKLGRLAARKVVR